MNQFLVIFISCRHYTVLSVLFMGHFTRVDQATYRQCRVPYQYWVPVSIILFTESTRVEWNWVWCDGRGWLGGCVLVGVLDVAPVCNALLTICLTVTSATRHLTRNHDQPWGGERGEGGYWEG